MTHDEWLYSGFDGSDADDWPDDDEIPPEAELLPTYDDDWPPVDDMLPPW